MSSNEIERKVTERPLKEDVTPYEIHKYLKEVLSIDIAPQRIYRDRSDGRLPSYRLNNDKDGKWMVKKDDATSYILKIARGPSKKSKKW